MTTYSTETVWLLSPDGPGHRARAVNPLVTAFCGVNITNAHLTNVTACRTFKIPLCGQCFPETTRPPV